MVHILNKQVKISYILVFIFIMFLSVYSCGDSSGENPAGGDGGGGTGVAYANITIRDQNGVIGKAVAVYSTCITMYSSTGYLYNLDWSGKVLPGIIYFSGTNCTGTAYDNVNQNSHSKGKTIFYSFYLNKYYKPKTVNSDGTAYINPTKVTYNSYDLMGTVYNASSSIYAVELVEASKSEAGIPDSIVPPLNISFE